jgi:hypothetical protein
MHAAQRKLSIAFWTDPVFVLRRLIPMAYGIFLAGFLISVLVVSAGRSPTLEDGIMSDLLSPIDNPRGYLISAVATVLCGLLLLPVAIVFQRSCGLHPSRWATLGAWIYRVGLIATIATGVTTPFQQSYVPIHVYLAFLAFMSLAAGLAICHAVAALLITSGRLRHATLATLQLGAFLYLTYLFFSPGYFNERRWFLAACEWVVSALVVTGTVSLAAEFAGGAAFPSGCI